MQTGVPSGAVDIGIIDTCFDAGDEVDTIRTACRIPGDDTGVG